MYEMDGVEAVEGLIGQSLEWSGDHAMNIVESALVLQIETIHDCFRVDFSMRTAREGASGM